MSVPPPPPSYRKLERSRSNRVVGGVCAGVAQYANIDRTLVRVLTVVLSLSFGFPVIVYLLALFLMPEEDVSQPPQGYPPVGGSGSYEPYPYQSGAPRQYGTPPSPEDEAVWGPAGAPWQQPPATAPQQQPPSAPHPYGAPRPPASEDERG